MADRSEVLELLRIADLTKQWPHLKPLHDHAMGQLQKAAEEHAPKPPPAPKVVEAPRQFIRPGVRPAGGGDE